MKQHNNVFLYLNRLSMLISAAGIAADTSNRMVPESTQLKAPNSTRKHVSFNDQPQVRHLPRPLMEQIPTLRGHALTTSVQVPLPPGQIDGGKRPVLPFSCQAQHVSSGFPSQHAQHPHEYRTPQTTSFSSSTFRVPMVPRSHW